MLTRDKQLKVTESSWTQLLWQMHSVQNDIECEHDFPQFLSVIISWQLERVLFYLISFIFFYSFLTPNVSNLFLLQWQDWEKCEKGIADSLEKLRTFKKKLSQPLPDHHEELHTEQMRCKVWDWMEIVPVA